MLQAPYGQILEYPDQLQQYTPSTLTKMPKTTFKTLVNDATLFNSAVPQNMFEDVYEQALNNVRSDIETV